MTEYLDDKDKELLKEIQKRLCANFMATCI